MSLIRYCGHYLYVWHATHTYMKQWTPSVVIYRTAPLIVMMLVVEDKSLVSMDSFTLFLEKGGQACLGMHELFAPESRYHRIANSAKISGEVLKKKASSSLEVYRNLEYVDWHNSTIVLRQSAKVGNRPAHFYVYKEKKSGCRH